MLITCLHLTVVLPCMPSSSPSMTLVALFPPVMPRCLPITLPAWHAALACQCGPCAVVGHCREDGYKLVLNRPASLCTFKHPLPSFFSHMLMLYHPSCLTLMYFGEPSPIVSPTCTHPWSPASMARPPSAIPPRSRSRRVQPSASTRLPAPATCPHLTLPICRLPAHTLATCVAQRINEVASTCRMPHLVLPVCCLPALVLTMHVA
jgi:hypothetical protein